MLLDRVNTFNVHMRKDILTKAAFSFLFPRDQKGLRQLSILSTEI